MNHWNCDWISCKSLAAQRTGDCLLCDQHLCRTHRQKPWHKCPKSEEDWDSYSAQYAATEARHIDELRRRIDSSELCARASMLRNGILCTVDLSHRALSTMMGNQNCHAEIMFDDGVKWLARFRLTRTSTPPRQVCDCILQSEAATMTYLQRNTQIPSPRIFDWACESSPGNALGVDYIMMEKLDGKPLNWQGATLQQKEKVMQQLVEILLEIEKHPFKSIGSPILVEDEIQIQGLTYPSTFQAGKGRLGPFPSALEWIQATLKAYLTMIASGEIDPCCPIETYLVHRFRQEIIDSLLTDIPADEQFFLKHPDDKGDHILVNESFDIVGIIDWEWTQTVTKAEAFSSPCMMWPVGAFYDGFNELAVDELRLADIFRERGRKDLADYVIKCRKLQRFFFALGVEGSFLDADTLPPLFTGLRRAFEFEDEGWEAWKSKALIQWKDDKMLLDLIARNGPRCGGTSRPVEPWTAKTP